MFGLSFLSPLYLLGALAIALPIALHLFNRRTETVVDFPAVRLLERSPVEQQRRRRLREILLLALRVSALVLLAGSFARPYLSGRVLAADTPLTLVALDTSFSMGHPDTIAEARALATQAIREAPSTHAVAVATFDLDARVVVPPSTDRSAAVAAVAVTQAGALGTRFGSVVARAAETFGGRGGQLVVVSDLQEAGWTEQARAGLPEDIELRVASTGAVSRNVAVVQAERRGSPGEPARIEATVQNFGLEQRDVTVILEIDGREANRVVVTAPPNAAVPVSFAAAIPASGAARVSAVDEGGVPGDDQRFVLLDAGDAARATVIVAEPGERGGGLYVDRALGVADRGQGFSVTVADGRAFSAWTPEQVQREQVLVVLATRTLDRQGRALIRQFMNAGGAVWLSLGPDIDMATLGETIDGASGVVPDPVNAGALPATLVLGDVRHPIFRPFARPAEALGDVSFRRYRRVDETGRTVLARFSGGAPALVEVPRPTGRLLIFASDLDNQWNRFPLSPAFVPFVVETARYLTEGTREPRAWTLPSVPPGVPAAPGVATLDEGTPGARRVAVNVDPAESSLRRVTADDFTRSVPRTPPAAKADPVDEARRAESEQRLWQLGLVAMFVALAGEGLIGRRAG
ncbi:MAG: BatA domain-containing protein [Acidobacteria bacterium]|nr:BatA domain-containing protein [Acidobacteriota bacterium]